MAATYWDRAYRGLLLVGVIELVASCGVIACGALGIAFKSRLFHIGHGIWAGVIFALTSSSAIAAGVTRSRGYLVSHIASCAIACIFTLPGLTTLLFIEKISDSWYTYWTDADVCREGCYASDGEYMRVSIGHWFGAGTATERHQCDSAEWKSKCHPNTTAVALERATLVILTVLASMFVLSSSLTCCILCRCRSSRDEVYPLSPADSIIVYTTYAVPNYHHAAYYNVGNINWAIPSFPNDLTTHTYRRQAQPPPPPPPPPAAPPPSYDESQTEQQLRQQMHPSVDNRETK